MENQVQKKIRLDYINFLRFIALILVILAHSSAVYTGNWGFKLVNNESNIIKYITRYFQTIRMPLFVFISGYLYHFNRVKLGKYNITSDFIKNKSKRLLVPYFVTGVFFMIPVQMIFNIYSDNETYLYKVFNEILLANMPGHLWFLLSLFQIAIVFYLLEKYFNKKGIVLTKKRIIITLISLSLLGFVTRNIPNIYQVQSSIENFIYYFLGYIFSNYIHNIRNGKYMGKYILILHFLLFNIQYFILGKIVNSTTYIIGFKFLFRQITSILGITFMFIYSLKLCEDTKIVDKLMNINLIRLIDENKFYIYLFHQPVLKVVLVNIGNIDIQPFTVVNVLFWATLIISVILSMIYKRLKNILF